MVKKLDFDFEDEKKKLKAKKTIEKMAELSETSWVTEEDEEKPKTKKKKVEYDEEEGYKYKKSYGIDEKEWELMTDEEQKYWMKLNAETRSKYIAIQKEIEEFTKEDKPPRFMLYEWGIPLAVKSVILEKTEQLTYMEPSDSEYFKLQRWVDNIFKVPFGKYITLPIDYRNNVDEIQQYLTNFENQLDNSIYGHDIAKNKLIQVISQWITNPSSCGNVLALQGPPGIGKTTLIKDGLSKALGRPFAFIPLGGATDSAFLEGHSYTYEGSLWGRIVNVLMETKCMNPVIFFDELDKVSETKHGEEIIGILTHLTDASQNDSFHDRYFSGIDFDLSKCLFIFSYNDESKINPILKDRLNRLHLKGFSKDEKKNIFTKFILPELFENINFNNDDLIMNSEVIDYLVQNYSKEEGVRNLKRAMETILLKINLYKLNPKGKYPYKLENFSLPYTLTQNCIKELLKDLPKDGVIPLSEGAKMMYS